MKHLILHIGWPKTGTSSIQGKLASNPEGLAKLGLLYPTVERYQDTHHNVCGLLINHKDPFIPQPKGDLKSFVNYLVSEEHHDAHTAIVSSEGMCRATSVKPSLRELTSRFNVTVVACLRDPIVWANSLYNQLMKMSLHRGNSIDLEKLSKDMVLQNFRYSERLQIWANSVGQSNVKVLAFEEGQDFSKLFFESLEIDISLLPLDAPRNNANRSLGVDSLRFLQFLIHNNIDMTHTQKTLINRKLHNRHVEKTPNLLDPEIENLIRLEKDEIATNLSEKWLGRKKVFLPDQKLAAAEDIYSYDNDEIRQVARDVLEDEPDILEQALKKL